MILITPLDLVYPLFASLFLTTSSAWRLIRSRAAALGRTEDIKQFFDWMGVYMQQPAWSIVGMTSVNLVNTKLQQCQALAEKLVLNPPPSKV